MRFIISGVALLALASAGCRDREERDQGAAGKPVEQAEQSLERAAEAADRAADKREELRDQREDVRDERQDLLEQQREAAQAQRESREALEQARRAAANAEQQLDQVAPAGQTDMAGQAATTIRGDVVQADSESILVRREDGGTMKFSIEPQQTQLMRGGQALAVENLRPGAKVTVHFRTQGTNAIAQHVDVE